MSDRSTKPSPRSRNAKAGSRGANTRSVDGTRRVNLKAQLGELEFSDWYESEVFEPSAEERMETRATGGRAPTRLMARMAIAAGARRERNRAAREERQVGEATETRHDINAHDRVNAPTPKAEPEAAIEARPEPKPQVEKPRVEKPRVEKPPAATPPAPTPPTPKPAVEPVPSEPLLIPELAERVGWRKRAAALIDRWADSEVAIAARLDEALAPAIPWANHDREPEGSRDDSKI